MRCTRRGTVGDFGRRKLRRKRTPANRITFTPRGFPSRAAVFSAGGHLSPWVPKLLLLGGDIEENPGPPIYTCRICNRTITKRQTSLQCNHRSKHWIHLRCSGILLRNYNPTYTCSLHQDPNSSSDRPNTSTETDDDNTRSPQSNTSAAAWQTPHPPPSIAASFLIGDGDVDGNGNGDGDG